jgi:hypothetical protein
LTPPPLSVGHVAFHFTGDASTASFSCSIDGADFDTCDSPESYSLGDGSHTFHVRAHNAAGDASAATSYTWTVDATPPVVMMAGGTDALLTSRSARASWVGTDAGGPLRYDVYERIGYEGSQAVVATNSTADNFQRNGNLGTTYCYQVVGYDVAGNATMSGERCMGTPQDERDASIMFLGAVARVTATGPLLNTLTVLDGPGESMSFTFTGRKYGIQVRRGPTSGFADVFVDGELVQRVDLYSAQTGDRMFLHQAATTAGTHTVEVRWTGITNPSATGTSIMIDATNTISR